MELSLYKRDVALESAQKQISVLSFQKESIETEMKSLKESLLQKDKVISKSEANVTEGQEELRKQTEKAWEMKISLENLNQEHMKVVQELRREEEEKIKKLLAERDLTLKEVHHRIKNNMNKYCR